MSSQQMNDKNYSAYFSLFLIIFLALYTLTMINLIGGIALLLSAYYVRNKMEERYNILIAIIPIIPGSIAVFYIDLLFGLILILLGCNMKLALFT